MFSPRFAFSQWASDWRWWRRLLPGALVILGTVWIPPLRHADGWQASLAATVAGYGLALMLYGSAWATPWQRCAGFFGLALAGQASALQLILAPSYSVYQHYVQWQEWGTSPHSLFGLGVLVQTVLTLQAARPFWPHWRQGIVACLRLWQRILLACCFLSVGVILAHDLRQIGLSCLLLAWIAVVHVMTLALAIAAIPQDTCTTWLAWYQRFRNSSGMARWLPWAVAAWLTISATALTLWVFEGVPHIPDDVSYLFQAKYFAAGHLYLPAPPEPESFVIGQVVNDGSKWFGYGFPGWPALLALGVLAGVPWLINPLLGGLTILLSHALVRRLYTPTLAHITVLLLAASPWMHFMAASFMTHNATVVWSLAALLALQKAREQQNGRWGTLAGLCLGCLFLTRPLEGVFVGGCIGLWALFSSAPRLLPRAILGLVTASIVVGSLVFPYNAILTGKALYAPHMKWTDEAWYPGADRLGFGAHIGNVGWPHIDPLPGHGLLDVLINTNRNTYMVNFELFGWSFGSLAFVVLFYLVGTRTPTDRLWLAIILAVALGHSLYWCSGGPDIGARYWYQMLVPLAVLSGRGIQACQERVAQRYTLPLFPVRLTAFVVAASLVAFVTVMPWRSFGKYYRYRGMSGDVTRLAQTHRFGHALVFIQSPFPEDFAMAFVLNPATLAQPGTIYAQDVGPQQRHTLQRAFPDRPLWFIGYAPQADRLRLLAGPLPAYNQQK